MADNSNLGYITQMTRQEKIYLHNELWKKIIIFRVAKIERWPVKIRLNIDQNIACWPLSKKIKPLFSKKLHH